MKTFIDPWPRRWAWLLGLCSVLSTPHAATLTVQLTDRQHQPLADAVVELTPVAGPALSRATTVAPTTAVVSQQRMRFSPVLQVVPVGSTVRFNNLDAWDHHVRGNLVPVGAVTTDAGFSFRIPGREASGEVSTVDREMPKPGPWQLGCHLHASMKAWVYVSAAPHFARTDAQGQVQWGDLPEGEWSVQVWHPDQWIPQAPRRIQLGAQGSTQLPWRLDIQPRKL